MFRRNTKSLTVLTLGTLIALFGCNEDKEAGSAATLTPVTTLPIAEQVMRAKQDLATRLDVDVATIGEESVRVVHWRSGAKGCPDPEMSYTMAITPGAQILLSVDDEFHRYHSGPDGVPFYCPADRAEAPALGQGDDVM